ncbi:methyltransferase [Sphingobacterium cellulitidis]|uniref:methyltransferase domain-containing protein n=1 Tax=Sphingobacterium cellulitidis TaxID=1768011 RepID=UPI000B941842|nr:methyltransferase domain-containing protein [Sphingobacterium cellulitidis]OYD46066.1 methyltransferase [Sphingobacterium cellulitidis]
MANKVINRDAKISNKIFDDRSLEKDYATLIPILKEGMHVLDIGCGTGAISNGIANYVGPKGSVVGIDNTEKFILSGQDTYSDTKNLELQHCDLFNFHSDEKFDLIVSARTLQWLNNPREAILKMKELLKPAGTLSILDYNHEQLEWEPQPPLSMQLFYKAFLNWRADAGMNNHISEDLADYFKDAGFSDIETINSDETYQKGDDNFISRIGIWSKVANLKQVVEEGYISEEDRLKAIKEYDEWILDTAQRMTMKLKDVRGTKAI